MKTPPGNCRAGLRRLVRQDGRVVSEALSKVGEHISRQQASKRLTRAAITSFVRGDEPLMTHLAVQAAFRVCRDVVTRRNPKADWLGNMIRPDKLKEFFRYHAKIANFLKHAERSQDETISVGNIQAVNENDIALVCLYYETAFPGSPDPAMRTFIAWQAKRHPKFFKDEGEPFLVALTEAEIWGMLETACSIPGDERERLASLYPDFDWT